MALTEGRNTKKLYGREQFVFPVAAGARIWQGALVGILAGHAVPVSEDPNLIVVGRAEDSADNRDGADGELNVSVNRGVYLYANSDGADEITQADILRDAFVVDDETVARTDGLGTRPRAGRIYQLDADGVWVETGFAG